MKRIIKILFNVVCKFVFLICLFILLLAIKSADWFLDTFGEMDFSIVLYQLFSPMEGTSTEILGQYYHDVFKLVCGITGLVMAGYIFCDIVFRKCYLKIRIIVRNRKIELLIGKKLYFIGKVLLVLSGTVILIVCFLKRAVALKVPEYFEEISHSSVLFEEEYVDPDHTKLEFPNQKRNLILIYLESMESTYASIEAGGAKTVNYIPELTKLAEENLNFSDNSKLGGAHVYTGGWTMAGILSSLAGVPYKLPVGGNEAGEYESFLPGITALGDILGREGYNNYFMCGSDAAFGGREAFYLQHGNYEILDYDRAKESGIIPKDYEVYWGMEDEKLYQYARERLAKIGEGDTPFNFTMLTVDTHHPVGYICNLCENQYEDPYANAIACASKQVYEFIQWIKEQDWYENTTIVVTGDHTSMNTTFWDDIGDYERTIYNCFINYPDSLQAVSCCNREFSTMDMFPTILASMDVKIEGNRLGLGTNLFSAEKTLPERMGKDAFLKELKMYSKFYFTKFVVG